MPRHDSAEPPGKFSVRSRMRCPEDVDKPVRGGQSLAPTTRGLAAAMGKLPLTTEAEMKQERRKRTPEGRRIEALMEVYGLPTPTLFARAIDVSQPRLSNVIT